MALDVIELQAFYASPLGQVARRILSARLRSPFGRIFAASRSPASAMPTPISPIFRDEAERAIALMPASARRRRSGRARALRLGARRSFPAAFGRCFARSRDHRSRARGLRQSARAPHGGLADAEARRPDHRHRAEPARALGSARHDAFRPGPALQPRPAHRSFARGARSRPSSRTEALFVPPLDRALILRSAVAFERDRPCLSLAFRRHPSDRGREAGLSRAAGLASAREPGALRADVRTDRSLAALHLPPGSGFCPRPAP